MSFTASPRADAEVIVVGGGHNGLVAAAYLARAGVDTLLVEARDHTGGCASTVDALGARVNICNCDHLFVRATPIHDELELADHGLRYVDLEPSYVAMRWDGGRPWYLFHDAERTLSGLARTHPDQVEGYRRYLDATRPVAELVLEVSTGRPSFATVTQAVLRRRGRGVMHLLRWARRSAVDVLREFFDDDDLLMPALATGPVVWGVDPKLPGTGLAALGYATKHLVQVGRPVGGSGALTDAIRDSFLAAGGRVRCATTVESLLIADNGVVGVRTAEGDELVAPTVITACDPGLVLTEWIDGDVPARVGRLRERWRQRPTRDGYESKIDAIVDEAPIPRALVGLLDDVDPTVPTMVIGPRVEAISAMRHEADSGRVASDPVMIVNTPSCPDPTMRTADGGHLLSLEVLWTPYAIDGGWDASPEPERWLTRFADLVQPGWLDGVRDWRVMTPVDYERQFNMRRGFTPSWAGTPLSAVLGRSRELTRYRTPVRGLYLCGAGTFPGAGIWGVSGRNVASIVIADRVRHRRPRWPIFRHPPVPPSA